METTKLAPARRYAERLFAAGARAASHRPARLLAVLAIVALDSLIWRAPIPQTALGLADELCHLGTAALIVTAWPPLVGQPQSIRLPAVLAASVLIDIDHLPKQLFGATFLTAGTHRPYGHTALAVIVVCALALALRKWSTASAVAWGVALGMVLHLIRDVATGGAALAWPLTSATVTYPYPLYGVVLLVAAWVLPRLRQQHD